MQISFMYIYNIVYEIDDLQGVSVSFLDSVTESLEHFFFSGWSNLL